MKKKHDLFNRLLLRPASNNLLQLFLANTGKPKQLFRMFLNNREDLHPVSLHQYLCQMGANPLDHTGGKIFGNSLKRIGRDNDKMRCLELDSPRFVILPVTDSFDMLTRIDSRNTAHHGYQITILLYLEAQNSKPRRLAEKTYLINHACYALLSGREGGALVHERVWVT